MRKFLLFSLLIPALLASCHDTKKIDPRPTPTSYGDMQLPTMQQVLNAMFGEHETGSVDEIVLTLSGQENKTIAYPEDGLISKLEVGNYNVSVVRSSSFKPAFESIVYNFAGKGTVVADKTTTVEMQGEMSNAGICFVYDQLSAELAEGLIPTVKQGNNALVFETDHRDARGYFNPGKVIISFTLDGEPVSINGKTEIEEDLEKGKISRLTLEQSGQSLSLSVQIEILDDPTVETGPIIIGDPGENIKRINDIYHVVGYFEGDVFGNGGSYWTIQMETPFVGPNSATDLIFLGLHTEDTGTTLPAGIYPMAKSARQFEIGTTEPGYYFDGDQWGCYYLYSDDDTWPPIEYAAVPGAGNVKISVEDSVYTIDFFFYDTMSVMYTGVFVGEISVFDHTK